MASIVLFTPLIGAIIAGLGWRVVGEVAAQWIATSLMLLAALLSWIIYLTLDADGQQIQILRFIESGSLSTDWSIRLDRLTVIMMALVTTLSSFVHLYSIGYLAGDPHFREDEAYRGRFFGYLGFFSFAMLILVTADDLVQLFAGWQAVALGAALLVGFYHKRPAAARASVKIFVVNRFGDFAFGLAIFALFLATDSLRFDDVFAAAPDLAGARLGFLGQEWAAANVIGCLLVLGAAAKSAQVLFHVWVVDAAHAPAPFAALLHGGTMVAAGVFVLCRMSPVLEVAPAALFLALAFGLVTAVYAASVAMVQTEMGRAVAFLSISHLGLMFVAVGVGAYWAAIFHVLTHAFFASLLFLAAGSVVRAMAHDHDLGHCGGLRQKMPVTFWLAIVGALSASGVGLPLAGWLGFAGFGSLQAITASAYAASPGIGFWAVLLALTLTSFAVWRLVFVTFIAKPTAKKKLHEELQESPKMMLVPMAFVAVGAAFAGALGFGALAGDVADVPGWVTFAPVLAMALGVLAAFQCYVRAPETPRRLAESQPAAHSFLLNGWYVDAAIDAVITRPAQAVGDVFARRVDQGAIDGTLDAAAMRLVPVLTRLTGRTQTGRTFTYAFVIVGGLGGMLALVVLAGGAP